MASWPFFPASVFLPSLFSEHSEWFFANVRHFSAQNPLLFPTSFGIKSKLFIMAYKSPFWLPWSLFLLLLLAYWAPPKWFHPGTTMFLEYNMPAPTSGPFILLFLLPKMLLLQTSARSFHCLQSQMSIDNRDGYPFWLFNLKYHCCHSCFFTWCCFSLQNWSPWHTVYFVMYFTMSILHQKQKWNFVRIETQLGLRWCQQLE